MTQFTTPPDGPDAPYVPGYTTPIPERPPWSAAAITGFVLSWLGCTIIGAVLGLILGIVGITRTTRGRRRGLGLAIAAIPISLLTAVLGVAMGFGFLMATQAAVLTAQLPTAFRADAAGMSESVEALRGLCSDDFNESVNAVQLEGWLVQVAEDHGRLVEILSPPMGGSPPGPGGESILDLPVKFVNGRANVRITISRQEISKFRIAIDDIEVDGSSPRQFAADSDQLKTGD